MKSDIKLFQEQQPNGKIATSWTRISLGVPLLMAVGYLIFTLWEHHRQMDIIFGFLKDKLIDQAAFIAIAATLKTTDYVVLGSLLGITFGVKLFQKGQENKAMDNEMKETPDEVKIVKAQAEIAATPDPLTQAKADYLAKFSVVCPDGKTLDEITNAINTNTAFV